MITINTGHTNIQHTTPDQVITNALWHIKSDAVILYHVKIITRYFPYFSSKYHNFKTPKH